MKPADLPHFLRVTRALTLVTGIAVPSTYVAACGGSTATDEKCSPNASCDVAEGGGGVRAYDDGGPGPQDAGLVGYDGNGPHGVVPYDAGRDAVSDAEPDVALVDAGIVPYDGGHD